MDERYGDLVAMDPTLASQVAVPRRVEVVTDLFGFRNARPFADQRMFVVGDSFVAGIGVTQAQTITEQLRTDFKINAVNLGYPAEPIHYGRRIAWARNQLSPEGCYVMVVFEGNDFSPFFFDEK